MNSVYTGCVMISARPDGINPYKPIGQGICDTLWNVLVIEKKILCLRYISK